MVDDRETRKHNDAFDSHLHEKSLEIGRELGIREIPYNKEKIDFNELRGKAADLSSLLHINPQRVLDLTVFPGLQLLSPPYDTSWNVGSGMPVSAWDGVPMCFGGSGFSASGFGIQLVSDRHVSVSVMPQGQFTGGWLCLDAAGTIRSLGGTGTCVYSDSSLIVSRQPRVWDIKDPPFLASGRYDLPFADTATPAYTGSLGSIPLAPVFFEMLPGHRYLVWFYVWLINEPQAEGKLMVFAEAKVPFIAVSVGQPLNLH